MNEIKLVSAIYTVLLTGKEITIASPNDRKTYNEIKQVIKKYKLDKNILNKIKYK